jgi:DNA-binding XRE family transcriptional regulator
MFTMSARFWNWDGAAGVGRLLALARTRAGLTQAQLGKQLGVSATNIGRIEVARDLRVSTLIDIARALGFEPMLVPKHAVPAVRALLDAPDDAGAQPERGRFT